MITRHPNHGLHIVSTTLKNHCPVCHEHVNKALWLQMGDCAHTYHVKCLVTWYVKEDSLHAAYFMCPACRIAAIPTPAEKIKHRQSLTLNKLGPRHSIQQLYGHPADQAFSQSPIAHSSRASISRIQDLFRRPASPDQIHNGSSRLRSPSAHNARDVAQAFARRRLSRQPQVGRSSFRRSHHLGYAKRSSSLNAELPPPP